MASVVKDCRNRSPYWTCCYTDATGRRLKKSTRHTNKKKALEFCLALERGEALARNGALSEARLRKLLEETFERTSGVPIDNHTVARWFDEWSAQKSESRSEATAERYCQVKRDFLASLGARADLPLDHITSQDIRAYRKAELAAGKSSKTANTAVKIISSVFNRALRLGKIKLNPCHELDALPEDTAERSTFSCEQIQDLIRCAPNEEWKLAILLGFYTGARLSDIVNL